MLYRVTSKHHHEHPHPHRHEQPNHTPEDIHESDMTTLVVSHGHHVYSFATTRLPVDVLVGVTSNDQQGCGNDMDQDRVEVTLALVCEITSDSAEVSWVVETV